MNKINYFLAPRIFAIFLVALFMCSGLNSFSQKKKSKKEKHFEAELGFATIYDNNILKYSEKYLDRFMNHQDSGRFHIETYDDIILYQSADLSATYRLIKELKTRFTFYISNNFYAVNGIKNWYYVSIGLQQYITKQASFKVFYSHITDYYVRHFRDNDWVEIYGYTPETFVPFSYAKDNYGFWIQNVFFKNTRGKLSFDFSQYFHNEHYTEYDCKNYIIGGEISQPVNDEIKLDIGYKYEYSDALGYDENGETRETADDADATYREHDFGLGLTWELPDMKKLKHEVELTFGYQRRTYLSEHFIEDDPEHVGRVDDNIQLALNYTVKLSKSFNLGAFYRLYMRDSGSESNINEAYLSAEKDYKQSQVGLKLTYNIKF
jgi:hypothetical protein